MRLGVIGLGKLGLPLACFLARAGHDVYGYDANEALTESLRRGLFKTFEPDCNYSAIKVVQSMNALVEMTDAAFLCVNTPDGEDGMDLSQVKGAVKELARHLDEDEDVGYAIIVCSTVMPGTAREVIRPLLPITTQVISNPVWIALGSVMRDLRSPPMCVVGCDDPIPATWLPIQWAKMANISPEQILVTDTRTAEFIKLAHNAWACTKMAFIGELGDGAGKLGINIEDVARFFAAGGERPGAFFRYGPPFGGACFPRDLEYFIGFSDSKIAWEAMNRNKHRIQDIALAVPRGQRVAILGRSYKYGVPVAERSVGVELERIINTRGDEAVAFDVVDGRPDLSGYDTVIVAHAELSEMAEGFEGKVINLWKS